MPDGMTGTQRRSRPLSIRARLVLLVLSILMPSLFAALWTLVSLHHRERMAIEHNMRNTAHALSMVIDRELERRLAVARVLAASLASAEGVAIRTDQLQAFERQAQALMQGLDGWVVLSAQRGGVLLDTRSTGDPLSSAQPGGAEGYLATVVAPVERAGREVAQVTVTMRPAVLQRVLDEQGVQSDWVATVLDHHHRIVARTPGGAAFVGRLATADLQQQLRQHRQGWHTSVTLDGVPVVLYFATSEHGWTQLLGVRQSSVATSLPGTVVTLGFSAAALLGLALLGARAVSRRIAEPIVALGEAAARLGRGESVPRLSTGIVECDTVAHALADAAEQQEQARDRLEQEVARAVERTREAEQRASHDQRVQALGRLTGGVAHDFNNLLGVISNSAYLIERQVGPGAARSPVAAILRAVEVGSRLTQQLLRFAGRQPVRPNSVELAVLLPEVSDLLKAVLGSGIRPTWAVQDGTRAIRVDASELELALINLALNARDAMPQGGELTVQARDAVGDEFPELAAGDYVVLTVSDTGTGVAAELLNRVFEPFFTSKGLGKGTGLGLSQVHGFCTQAGGFARITSKVGVGTTVWLVLPAGAIVAQPTGSHADEALAQPLADCRILLVEDNEELLQVTTELLEGWGAQVVGALNAQEALRWSESAASVDVLLTDLGLPGELDGVQLGLRLRARWPTLPVVLISGFSEHRRGTLPFPVLQKPCTPAAMVRALRRAIGRDADG